MVTYIFKNEGFEDVNYLDDLGGAEIQELADVAFQVLGQILEKIGIKESVAKAQAPDFIMIFLEVLFNTIEMMMTITDDRLVEIRSIIHEWLRRKTATLHDMQKLLGKLNFICGTVRAGRVFVSRMINKMRNMPTKGKRRIDASFYKDLIWWNKYLEEFDGVNIIPRYDWSRPDGEFSTDSCLTGCGGWSQGDFFHAKFPSSIINRHGVHINKLEALALVVALRRWIGKFLNRNILVYCDNQPTVDIINTGRAWNTFAQAILREVCYITARHNTVIKVIHRKGSENRICDYLGRWHLDPKNERLFRSLTQEFNLHECVISHEDFELTADW